MIETSGDRERLYFQMLPRLSLEGCGGSDEQTFSAKRAIVL
jgi:hypothetical protein